MTSFLETWSLLCAVSTLASLLVAEGTALRVVAVFHKPRDDFWCLYETTDAECFCFSACF